MASYLPPEQADALIAKGMSNPNCLQHETSAKVALGAPVDLASFHDVVRISTPGGGLCTGVYIAPDTVLTAAHCTCASDYKIEIQTAPNNFSEVIIEERPVRFPGYDCNKKGDQPGRDLAFFKTERLDLSSSARTVFLGSSKSPYAFRLPIIRPMIKVLSEPDLRSLFLTGFGRTETGRRPETLLGVSVSIISRFCPTGRAYRSVCAMYREFALGRGAQLDSNRSADSCKGDSGAPVFRIDSSLTKKPGNKNIEPPNKTLVGIVSRAIRGVKHAFPGACGGGGVYTAVGTKPVLAWLDEYDVDYNLSYELRD